MEVQQLLGRLFFTQDIGLSVIFRDNSQALWSFCLGHTHRHSEELHFGHVPPLLVQGERNA